MSHDGFRLFFPHQRYIAIEPLSSSTTMGAVLALLNIAWTIIAKKCVKYDEK